MEINAKAYIKKLEDYYSRLYQDDNSIVQKLRGHKEKLEIIDAGYSEFIRNLLGYVSKKIGKDISELRVLDFGCGTGELTVLINKHGAQCFGLDIHKEHLDMARILAAENNLDANIFIKNDMENMLPFEDDCFDLIVSFSVFEHIENNVLTWLLPEFYRTCKGIVYTLVPNPIKPIDDHTNLAFLGLMPRLVALRYIKIRGADYKISRSGDWDVYYRFLSTIDNHFKRSGFTTEHLDDKFIYPTMETCPPIKSYSKNLNIFGLNLKMGIPLFPNFWTKCGVSKYNFYPYLNLISTKIKSF